MACTQVCGLDSVGASGEAAWLHGVRSSCRGCVLALGFVAWLQVFGLVQWEWPGFRGVD